MLSALGVVAPIFALIGAGFLARRLNALGPHASRELNRFVVFLALPALLFDVMANVHAAQIWRPHFIGAFGLAVSIVFAAVVAARVLLGGALADATLDGLSAGYGNTGYVGLPLGLIALGPQSQPLIIIAMLFTACLMFGVAIVLIEIDVQDGARLGRLVFKVLSSLARNPLVVAPVAGGALNAAGLAPPSEVEAAVRLLGAAASPCALVALGLFFAGPRAKEAKSRPLARGRGETATMAAFLALKLLAAPALCFLFASRLFPLDPAATRVAVLMAALPTGTGAFMLAEYYGREIDLSSKVMLASTAASILTLSAYLAVSG